MNNNNDEKLSHRDQLGRNLLTKPMDDMHQVDMTLLDLIVMEMRSNFLQFLSTTTGEMRSTAKVWDDHQNIAGKDKEGEGSTRELWIGRPTRNLSILIV